MNPERNKYCSECNLYKPIGEFKKLTTKKALGTSPDGYSRLCTNCFKNKVFTYESGKEPNNRKARRRDKRARRIEQVAVTYGLSEQEYMALIEKQANRCAICGSKDEGKVLCVDHDHNTGKVRGLLCHNCNVGLGNFKDNSEVLASAIGYLNIHGQSVVEKPLNNPEKESINIKS